MNKHFGKRLSSILAAVLVLILSLAAFADGLDTEQKVNAYYSLATSYIERQNYQKAKEYILSCLELIGENNRSILAADLHLKLGCVYTLEENNADALAELDLAIDIQPDLAEAYLVRAQILADSQLYTEAAVSMQQYIDLSGDTTKNDVLAQLLAASGESDKAISAFDSFVEDDGQSETEAAFNMGEYKMSLKMYAEAIPNFEDSVADEEFAAASAYNLGVCYMQLGDFDSALQYFELCVEKGGSYDGLYYNRAVCCMMAGRSKDAADNFTVSILQESFVQDATYNRALCRMQIGEFEGAAEDFTAYIGDKKIGKDDANVNNAFYLRAICRMSVSDFDAAAADFTSCIKAKINIDDSRFNRALSYLQGGQYKKAINDFTRCIKSGNSADEAVYYRHVAYHMDGQTRNAIKDLTTCIENGFNPSQCYYERAMIYKELGKEAEYLADLEASVAQ